MRLFITTTSGSIPDYLNVKNLHRKRNPNGELIFYIDTDSIEDLAEIARQSGKELFLTFYRNKKNTADVEIFDEYDYFYK